MPTHRHVLSNSLRLLIIEDPSFPVVAVNVWIGAGSRHEPPHLVGGSHFLEHLTARGTAHRAPLQDRMEIIERGGRNGAATSYDGTQYYNVVARADFELAVESLADVLLHASLPETQMRHEKRVVSEELRIEQDKPYTQAVNGLKLGIYGSHPYGRPVIGSLRSVASLTAASIREYYRHRYVPNNMVVVVVGDVRPADALNAVRTHFSSARPNSRLSPGAGTPPPIRTYREARASTRHSTKSIFTLGFRAPAAGHPHRAAFEVMCRLLGGGHGSRLEQAGVMRAQIARYLSCWYEPLQRAGMLAIVGSPHEAEDMESAKQLVWRELWRLWEDGVTEAEVARATQGIELELLFSQEDALERAKRVGEAALYGHDADYVTRLPSVSPSDVRCMIQTYLVRNQSFAFDLVASGGRRRRAELERTQIARERVPALADAAHRRGRHAQDVVCHVESGEATDNGTVHRARPRHVRQVLDNGLRLMVLPVRRFPLVSLALATLAGSRSALEPGLSRLTANSLLYGGWTLDVDTVRALLGRWGGRWSMQASYDVITFTITLPRAELPDALALCADIFIHPTLYQAEVTSYCRSQAAEAQRDLEDARKVVAQRFHRRVYGRHPYAQPLAGTGMSLGRLTRTDVAEFHERCYRPGSAVLSLVGDLDVAEARRCVDRLFGGWAGGAVDGVPLPAPVARPGQTVARLARQQAHLIVGGAAPTRGHEDYWSARVLASLLNNRAFTDLVYGKSLAYHAGCTYESLQDGGSMRMYLSTRVAQARIARGELFAKMRQVRDEPPSARELRGIKRLIIGSRALEEQSSAKLASRLAHWELLFPPEWRYDSVEARIRGVSRADVQRVAQRYLADDALICSLVEP